MAAAATTTQPSRVAVERKARAIGKAHRTKQALVEYARSEGLDPPPPEMTKERAALYIAANLLSRQQQAQADAPDLAEPEPETDEFDDALAEAASMADEIAAEAPPQPQRGDRHAWRATCAITYGGKDGRTTCKPGDVLRDLSPEDVGPLRARKPPAIVPHHA